MELVLFILLDFLDVFLCGVVLKLFVQALVNPMLQRIANVKCVDRVLAKILIPNGARDVPVGKPLCVVVSPNHYSLFTRT